MFIGDLIVISYDTIVRTLREDQLLRLLLNLLFYHVNRSEPTFKSQHKVLDLIAASSQLRTTVPFVTAHPEIFHCTHHPVIPDSDLYFPFCSIFDALSKKASK